ncbi:hypothetical protein CBR_g22316 [Chara braunii]|uniref:Uncharacterized protein n=1 Tax=Chara braunii TaxID=69332 RepID=A0A388L2T8_CHABU|nr:hypothetical protein CBR_g22316 [Chara braunii]|eukprot:GBG76568.1 hypothetical protein CBR_g22316 [Chara braunii]
MSFSKLKRLNRSKFISPGPDVDPAFSGNLDSWPHIKELIHTYKTDWIYPEFKYGHFYPIPPPEFEPQIFEQEDSNLEAELNLSQISLTKQDSLRFSHANGHDLPSGKHGVTSADANGAEEVEKKCIEKPKFNFKHLGGSPLSAYDPVFNWDMERATVAGQRVRVPPNMGTSSDKVPCHDFCGVFVVLNTHLMDL